MSLIIKVIVTLTIDLNCSPQILDMYGIVLLSIWLLLLSVSVLKKGVGRDMTFLSRLTRHKIILFVSRQFLFVLDFTLHFF